MLTHWMDMNTMMLRSIDTTVDEINLYTKQQQIIEKKTKYIHCSLCWNGVDQQISTVLDF